tara:strand:- start:2969 stop:3955 length:987 start_codon:yes stop_codon:yes gene_type:complete
MEKLKYKKIIIWGHPLFSHTHSYVHEAYYKSFKSMGYDVHWFHDDGYPKDFDFTNCLFIGEGFADKNIPLNGSSCYLIMYCPSPDKYVGKVKRYIDIRMSAINFKDHIQEYSLDKDNTIKVGSSCYFEPSTNEKIHLKNDYVDYVIDDYDKIYISWATNLLPNEIDFENMNLPRENNIYLCGNLSKMGVCENYSTYEPFINECQKHGIQFHHNNSWQNPLSTEEVINRTQKSILGVDIRGPEHLRQNLIPCRVFKNISYGHLGLTNSEEIYNEMDGNCIYNSDTAQLFHDGMKEKENYDLIKKGMLYVKENHTYINRIKSMIKIINND